MKKLQLTDAQFYALTQHGKAGQKTLYYSSGPDLDDGYFAEKRLWEGIVAAGWATLHLEKGGDIKPEGYGLLDPLPDEIASYRLTPEAHALAQASVFVCRSCGEEKPLDHTWVILDEQLVCFDCHLLYFWHGPRKHCTYCDGKGHFEYGTKSGGKVDIEICGRCDGVGEALSTPEGEQIAYIQRLRTEGKTAPPQFHART